MMVIMMVKSDRNGCDYDDVMVVLTNDAGNNKKNDFYTKDDDARRK